MYIICVCVWWFIINDISWYAGPVWFIIIIIDISSYDPNTIATPPHSTKSRTSDFSVSRGTNSNRDFGLNEMCTEGLESLDLVDFGGVAFSVQNVRWHSDVTSYVYSDTSMNLDIHSYIARVCAYYRAHYECRALLCVHSIIRPYTLHNNCPVHTTPRSLWTGYRALLCVHSIIRIGRLCLYV